MSPGAAEPGPRRRARPKVSPAPDATPADAPAVLAWLERRGTRAARDGLARYGLPSDTAYGVPVGVLLRLAKQLGRDHALAAALWASERYEARLLAAMVDEPARVTSAQMERWCRAFDNWGLTDTVCFHLFDRTPHAWDKVARWAGRREEFVRRAAFALLASLVAHDKAAPDDAFRRGLALIERAADDERNFVKKGVNWALRCVGKRNAALHAEALALARRLAASASPSARWIGRDAVRDLTNPAALRRLARQRAQA